LGKAPPHVDVSALRHTEIVYRSAEEIRKALIEAGAPSVLLDLTVDEEDDDAADKRRSRLSRFAIEPSI
jgi:hypothetical protein